MGAWVCCAPWCYVSGTAVFSSYFQHLLVRMTFLNLSCLAFFDAGEAASLRAHLLARFSCTPPLTSSVRCVCVACTFTQ